MSNLEAFSEKVRTEPALQERLATVKALPPSEQLPALIALSEKCGCPVTAEELQRPPSGELSEADLSSMSGGTQWEYNPFASTPRSEWFTPSPSQSQQAATQAKAAAHAFEKAMSPQREGR